MYCTFSVQRFFNTVCLTCRPRKPRKNTTKYGPQAKVPTKIGQNEVGVEAENVEERGVVVAENVEESGVVVAATRELLFGDSPNRVTIR